MWKIELFKTNFDRQEELAVIQVLKSGWLSQGEKTKEFEQRFCRFLGAAAPFKMVANGTAALHLALLAAGVGAGDEVIVPALTFIADINVVQLVGATPRVVDITSAADWDIAPKKIAAAINKRSRAVIVVHYAGFSCDMAPISEICRRNNITLIEDAAHAPGAAYDNKMLGSIGDFGCFSFYTNKNISAGEGGGVACRSAAMADRIGLLRSHGMSVPSLDRYQGRAVSYDVKIAGLNYRCDDLRAALALIQLEKLPQANDRRRRCYLYYLQRLAGLRQKGALTVPFTSIDPKRGSSWHIMPILPANAVDRPLLIDHLKAAGIQSSIHYPSFADFSAYRHLNQADFPLAADVSSRQLTLPLYPDLREDEIDYIVDQLEYFYNNYNNYKN